MENNTTTQPSILQRIAAAIERSQEGFPSPDSRDYVLFAIEILHNYHLAVGEFALVQMHQHVDRIADAAWEYDCENSASAEDLANFILVELLAVIA